MKVNLTKISFLFYLFLLTNGKIYAQATDGLPATGNVYTAAKFLGWGATSGDLNFRTNNTTRMVIKNTTGLVGIGNPFTATSLLHVNSIGNTIGGETFRTTAQNSTSSWRMELGTSGNAEKFRITADTNRVELGSVQNGKFSVFTNSVYRFQINNGGSGVLQGYAAFGNNLPITFTPLDRLHLHQSAASDVRTRFTHSTATSGSTLGINNAGQYLFTQFENQAMIFETNGANERFRITQDDRIFAFRNTNGYVPLYNAKFVS